MDCCLRHAGMTKQSGLYPRDFEFGLAVGKDRVRGISDEGKRLSE